MNKVVVKYNSDDILELIRKDVIQSFDDRPNHKLFIDDASIDNCYSNGQRFEIEAHVEISFEKRPGEAE